MNKVTGQVTGLKRKNEHLDSDEESIQPPATKHPTPSLDTSRCTLQTIAGQQAPLREPPEFPGAPLNPCFGVWGWLPPSLLEEFRGKHYDPLMQAPQQEPDPLPAVPADIPPTVIAQPAVDTGAETDAQFLEQLQAVCKQQVASRGRASIAVEILQRPQPLQQRIALLMEEVHRERKVSQGLLILIERCEPNTRVRDFLMSLFLALLRTPDLRHRENFIDNLPSALSPELQSHTMDVQNYWRYTAINTQCTADTNELARKVCEHFGWK